MGIFMSNCYRGKRSSPGIKVSIEHIIEDYMNINVSKVISEQIHVMCLLRRKSEKN